MQSVLTMVDYTYVWIAREFGRVFILCFCVYVGTDVGRLDHYYLVLALDKESACCTV